MARCCKRPFLPFSKGSTKLRILALESSLKIGSLATLSVERDCLNVLHELTLPSDQRSAQSLLPMLSKTLSASAWQPSDVDLICVTTGPGSFTGLRIGVTAAKMLAYTTGADLVGVHTLTTLAAGAPAGEGRLWAVLDAQRQELFATCFAGAIDPKSIEVPETSITPIADWLKQLRPGDRVVGPPVEKLAERLPAGVIATEQKYCTPSAAVVGRLGWAAQVRGKTMKPMQLTPHYFRRSAAEEKLDLLP